jgi:excisionase family DNA binding protein
VNISTAHNIDVEPNEEWLKTEEARRILRLGRNRFYECIADGSIPSRRFGRAIRVHRSAVIPPKVFDSLDEPTAKNPF